ncbi:MAG: hypothetical protein JRI36_08675 [Deltaproteobacteria bacterium]|nr:hypothetical protein [Deltaproteobacteria bacterium]
MIEQADMLYQHDPACWIKLKNTGTMPLTIWDPNAAAGQPVLRVLNVKTGEEQLFRDKIPPGKPVIPREMLLQVGESVSHVFRLKQKAGTLAPGEYEFSAIYEYGDDKQRQESSPVPVTIRPTTAKNLSLASGRGGTATFFYGTWINLDSEPPELVRSMFHFMVGGGIKSSIVVGKADVHTRPVISAPRNTTAAPGQWIAWVTNGILHALYVDEKGGPSATLKLRLTSDNVQIVPPLYYDSAGREGVTSGGALLCLGPPAGTGFQLLSLAFGSKEAVMEGSLNLAGPYPAWIETQVRSDGSRTALFVQVEGETIHLWAVPWPHGSAVRPAPVEPTPLASWKGRFVYAGVTMGQNDDILGACLAWIDQSDETGPDDTDMESKLEFILWTYRPDGKFIERGRHEVLWTSEEPIEKALIRVNEEGTPAALLRDQKGHWFVSDGRGNTSSAPGIFRETKLPLDLGFFGLEPVLVEGEGDNVSKWNNRQASVCF